MHNASKFSNTRIPQNPLEHQEQLPVIRPNLPVPLTHLHLHPPPLLHSSLPGVQHKPTKHPTPDSLETQYASNTTSGVSPASPSFSLRLASGGGVGPRMPGDVQYGTGEHSPSVHLPLLPSPPRRAGLRRRRRSSTAPVNFCTARKTRKHAAMRRRKARRAGARARGPTLARRAGAR